MICLTVRDATREALRFIGAFIATLGLAKRVEGDKLIGAICCSGRAGDQDPPACTAGADLLK